MTHLLLLGLSSGLLIHLLAWCLPQAHLFPAKPTAAAFRRTFQLLATYHQACRQQLAIQVTLLLTVICCGGLFAYLGAAPGETDRCHLFWLLWSVTLALTDRYYYLIEPRLFLTGGSILWLIQSWSGAPFHWGTLIYCGGLFTLLGLCLKDRFGLGDVLLLGSWSPWLSFLDFTFLLTLATFLGLIFLLFFRRYRHQPLPFVPFLTIALGYCLLL